MGTVRINKILVEEGADAYPITRKILRNMPQVPVERTALNLRTTGSFDLGKQVLQLLEYKGAFLKPCPGTRFYICCGYQILNIGTNCPIDCSYCILQSYFNNPNLRVFVNLEDELEKVLRLLESNKDRIFRIGTGEFTDSLALDPITGLTDLLLPVFSKRSNAILELKTKTDNIKNIVKSKHRDRIIVSWSLSSPAISAREEMGAESIERRIEAARICQSEGFTVAFHFDPLIFYPQWQDGYKRTLDLLSDRINPERVIWVSMGSFRYMPNLKRVIRERHKKTGVLNGEFVPGKDGKMRYFKPIRIDLYSFMKENLEKWYRDLGLYLCMESDDVWHNAFGWSPGNSNGLSDFLDGRVRRFFG